MWVEASNLLCLDGVFVGCVCVCAPCLASRLLHKLRAGRGGGGVKWHLVALIEPPELIKCAEL